MKTWEIELKKHPNSPSCVSIQKAETEEEARRKELKEQKRMLSAYHIVSIKEVTE